MSHPTLRLLLLSVALSLAAPAAVAQRSTARPAIGIPANILLRIIRAEDTRRWDDDLKNLLAHEDPKIRKRAALAAGRIGNEGAVPALADMVLMDRDVDVRQMAAFALGEIEAAGGAYALIQVLSERGAVESPAPVRARALEALGKIVAAVTSPGASTKPDEDWLDQVRAAIVNALRRENAQRGEPDPQTVLLGLTAVLRAKPDGVGKQLTGFLNHRDPRIVADALNTLTRLRLKDGNDKARDLLKHSDPIVRANAARVLGATEDKEAFDALLDRALHDSDERVVVSSIRALGSLKDPRASGKLIERGKYVLGLMKMSRRYPIEPRNELLEIATTIGIIQKDSRSADATQFLRDIRAAVEAKSPEVEIAMARVHPELYVTEEAKFGLLNPASMAQGLNEIAVIRKTSLELDQKSKFVLAWIHDLLDCDLNSRTASKRQCLLQPVAISPVLRAYAAFTPDDLDSILRRLLTNLDVIVRATSAELIGQQAPNEPNRRALIAALPRAMRDADNDAALAILDALAKQKSKEANDAIKTALDSKDHLVRRRAVSLLKQNGVGDFSDRIGTVQTRNTESVYRRAIARIGKKPTATVVTSKGSFTIEFMPEEAPLNVDNFLQLAKRRYFNGQTVPRVVPNFVVQAGDPRGDQNGGPGYTIRCEINEVPYERAAVGMALSGKDTGGSQWFVTHSPQPHLDGGYTVFGRVVRGMEVVDRIARGDRIVRVIVNER